MISPAAITPESLPIAREHYLPTRRSELVELLAGEPGLSVREREQFREFCRLIQALVHFEFHERLEQIKESYAEFDPDDESPLVHEATEDDRRARSARFFEQLGFLLERGNFTRLSRDDIGQALAATSDWGLNLDVDFDVFQRLEVFSRGNITTRKTRRRLLNFYRREEVDVPVYQRLVIAFQLHRHKRLRRETSPSRIHVKAFKNVPRMDLEMLLPGTQVKMTLFDQGKILLPMLSGIAITVVKIMQGVLVLAFAGIYGLLAFVGLVGGTIGYGVKSFFSYLGTKNKYQLALTEHLYYQNLDNNAGVLFRVLDEAEEQECQEAFLAYFLLWQRAGEAGWTATELDHAAESLLRDRAGLTTDFDVRDALGKLERLGLAETVSRHAPEPRWRATPMAAALIALDRAWDGFFKHFTPTPPIPAPHLPKAARQPV